MKWFWSDWQRLYEDTQRQMVAQQAAADARYDALLEKYDRAMLRVVGPAPVPIPGRTEDPVSKAIIAKARNSPILRKQLYDYATRARQDGQDEGQIAADILAGEEYTGGTIG